MLDERLARYSLEVPGLEHHEHPEYKDKFALVIQERGLLAQSLTSIRAVLQIIVRASVTLGLLASVDPSLVLILVFAIVPTLVGPRAERIRQRAMEATAEPLRKADHILQTATRAETAKELLTLRLGPEQFSTDPAKTSKQRSLRTLPVALRMTNLSQTLLGPFTTSSTTSGTLTMARSERDSTGRLRQ